MPDRPALKASQNSAALLPNPEMTPTPVITTLLTVCIFEPGVRDEVWWSRSAFRLLFLEFVDRFRVYIDALRFRVE